MAKPDWGALQDQFLTEHAKSGTPNELVRLARTD